MVAAMKRREALVAACDLVSEALPPVARREDGSWEHVVGVTIDGLPCLQFACTAVGRTREEEEIRIELRIAGTSDEIIPLFRDPPGQPTALLSGPVLTRAGTSTFHWSRGRDALRSEIAHTSRARWVAWRAEAVAVFARAPHAWTEACERVAGLDRPRAWMAADDGRRAAALAGLVLPGQGSLPVSHWTSAFIGLAPVLGSVVACDAPLMLARISNAATLIRGAPVARLVGPPSG